AEDGIRDFHVTGVQTCALPIYPDQEPIERLQPLRRRRRGIRGTGRGGGNGRRQYKSDDKQAAPPGGGRSDTFKLSLHLLLSRNRSEERRVGKESRAQRSTDDGT